MSKPILYFDMDNTLVDFQSGVEATPAEVVAQYAEDKRDDIPGVFLRMKPMPGAVEAARRLNEHYDCYILSTAPWGNPTALNDKLAWIKAQFGEDNPFYKKVIFTHHKELCIQPGAWLIDDRTAHGASDFGDHHIQIGSERFPNWESVLKFLL